VGGAGAFCELKVLLKCSALQKSLGVAGNCSATLCWFKCTYLFIFFSVDHKSPHESTLKALKMSEP